VKLRVYSVFDAKAEAFLPPFLCRARGEATRRFVDALTDEKHVFFQHAADFTLFELGEFDEDKGELIPAVPIVSLGNGLVYKSPELVKEASNG
jgi:uncharacterized protein